jgi:hypothetical protein
MHAAGEFGGAASNWAQDLLAASDVAAAGAPWGGYAHGLHTSSQALCSAATAVPSAGAYQGSLGVNM